MEKGGWGEDREAVEDYARVKRRERGSGKENKRQAERETMGGTVPRDRNRVCPLATLNATGK